MRISDWSSDVCSSDLARAIVWASEHNRRQVPVGYPTLLAEWAQVIAPGLTDRYLSATAYRGQQIAGEPDPGDRPDNLFEPVPGDAGAHGGFGEHSFRASPQAWATEIGRAHV